MDGEKCRKTICSPSLIPAELPVSGHGPLPFYSRIQYAFKSAPGHFRCRFADHPQHTPIALNFIFGKFIVFLSLSDIKHATMNFKNWNILLTAILTLVLFSACNRE